MPVTITAGITFSGGGLTMEFAPPSQATAGWFGAGRNPGPQSSISRITFATDTATASSRGPLSAARYSLGATGNFTNGWFAGGYANPGTARSLVDRITYATDTATATVRGPLNNVIFNIQAAGTATDGWWGSGYSPGAPGATSYVSRITFATDTATASARGPLTVSSWNRTAVTDSTTYGWFAGGQGSSTNVDRITYTTDTNTASSRGPLFTGANASGGTYTTSYGWIGGSPGSTVQRITYASDTATASVRGPIYEVSSLAGAGDDTYGWFGGGTNAGSYFTTVYRITYSTDTAAATSRGALFTGSSNLAASSGIQ
jgi:hypothetical protein